MWWKLAHKTHTTYSTFKKNFALHCHLWDIFTFLVKPKILILWIVELADFLTFTTIKTYLLSVWSIQIGLKFRDLNAFHHSLLKHVITGIKKQKEIKKWWKQWLITKKHFLKIIKSIWSKHWKNAIWHVFCCLVFAAFLRIGEFTYLNQNLKNSDFKMWHFIRQFVILQKDKLTLFLFASKTDFFKKECHIVYCCYKW